MDAMALYCLDGQGITLFGFVCTHMPGGCTSSPDTVPRTRFEAPTNALKKIEEEEIIVKKECVRIVRSLSPVKTP